MKNVMDEIERQVFVRRPALFDIFKQHGQSLLETYVKDFWQKPNQAPESLFLSAVGQELEKLYGKAMSKKAIGGLKSNPSISTVDHLGLWSHPFFVNSDLIYSLSLGKKDLGIVLATEGVSLNNSSSRSACLFWHEDSKLTHSSFLPDRLKNTPVLASPAVSKIDMERFAQTTDNRFKGVIKEMDMPKRQSFSSQASFASYKLWQKVFPSAPKLLFLPLETVVTTYLLACLKKKENIFYKIIASNKGNKAWLRQFAKEPTFLFWAINKNGKRETRQDLPKDYISLLEAGKLYPSGPLCFAVLLKAGLACAGGFNQTTWLSEVKHKLGKVFKDLGFKSTIDPVPTKNFAESFLAFLPINGELVSPSSLDLYLTGKDYYPKYKKLAKKITLALSLWFAMPAIYRVVVPRAEQMPEKDIVKAEKESLTTLANLL